MSRTEIEKAVDKMVEQEPSWDQVDFGTGPEPASSAMGIQVSPPEPVEGSRWYVATKLYGRFDIEQKRKVVTAPSPLKALVLADDAFGRAGRIVDTMVDWNDARFDGLGDLQPHPTVVVNHTTDDEIKKILEPGTGLWEESPDSLIISEEEWEVGVGRSAEAALAALARAGIPGGEPDWEEVELSPEDEERWGPETGATPFG